MGEVWRARDSKLGREVAIKTLPEEFAKDEERLARFEREAKLLASLNHPNIAAIYGLEEDNGTRFLVLELVEGDTLAERLKRGAIPVEESLTLALQIAEALEAAHEKGVIHRDLKPANIKVTPEGKIKVLDFGLAKAFAGDQADVNLSQSPTLSMAATQQGVILGTAAYMSPEQARGVTVDKRADIWAFGCVLYEMLTGRQVFRGELMSDVMASVLKSDPDYKGLPPTIHPKLRDVLRRCLEKEPKQRWHDAGDVRVDLEQVSADPSGTLVQPLAEGHSPRPIFPLIAAVVALVIVAAVAAWNLKPAPPPGAVVRLSHPLGEETFTRGGRPLVGISRDGTQVAYVADNQIYVKNLDETDARPVVGTDEDASTPVFSPDGLELAFHSSQDQELKRILVSGGTPIPITDSGSPYDMTWGDDDTIIYSLNDGIWQVDSNGGTATRIVEAREGENVFGSQLLPGGTHVLYSVWTGNDADQAGIVVEDLETHERKLLRTGGNDATYLPTGHLVYAFETDLFALQFDLETLNVGEDGPLSVVPGLNRGSPRGNPNAHYAISDTGTLVHRPGPAGRQNERFLAFVDRDGSTEVLPTPGRRYDFTRLSPDERRIAVQIEDDDGTRNIWIYDITSNVPRQLTFDGGERPLWTRDGTQITYLNEASLWNIDADLGGTATELAGTNVAGNEGPGSWSVDDEVLLFSSQSGIHAWIRDNNGGSVEVIVPGGPQADRVFAPQFSPEGRWFVYGANDQNRQLFALPYPVGAAGPLTITVDGGAGPIWPRRGNQLFFRLPLSNDPQLIQAIPIQIDPTLVVRSNPVEGFEASAGTFILAAGIPRYDVTPDGARLLTSISAGSRARATEAGDDYRRVNVILNFFEELKERVPVP